MATPAARPLQLDFSRNDEETDGHQLGKGGPKKQFSLTTGTLSPTPKSVKSVKLCVYTKKEGLSCPDMSFPSGRLTTTKQIMDKVLPMLGIPDGNRNMFGLWLRSKNLQLQLKSYHLPCKLFKRWKDLLSQYTSTTYEEVTGEEPILCLQRNAFLTLKDEKKLLEQGSDNKTTIDLLFHEAVYNVTSNHYPMSKEELHTLAGIQAAVVSAETGNEPNPTHQNTLRLFYPSHMCVDTRSLRMFSRKPSVFKQTQGEFVQAMRSACAECSEADQLKIFYLKKCWKRTFYGSVFFRGQIKKAPKAVHLLTYTDRQVFVAINMDSVHILSTSSPPEVLLYVLNEKLCWEFQPCQEEGEDFFSSLWLEYEVTVDEGAEQKKVFKLLQVFSRQAPMMDAMLGRCVADSEKKEEEQRQQGDDKLPPSEESPKVVHQSNDRKLQCDVYSEDGVCLRSSDSTLTKMRKKDKKGTVVKKDSSPSRGGEEHSMAEMTSESKQIDHRDDSTEALTSGV